MSQNVQDRNTSNTQSNRPNFLFFMTDQHRADWLGCMGHPVVKTPNIDAIAKQGTLFRDFHVASPVCMPNRASLMTGRMPSVHGLRYNGCILPMHANTFVDVLAAAGYDTAAIGKSHLQPFTEVAPHRAVSQAASRSASNGGAMQPIEEAWQVKAEEGYLEQPARYLDQDDFDFPTPYYGFDHVDMAIGHGDRCGGHYRQWFRRECPDWERMIHPDNELPHSYTCPQAYRTPIPEEYYPTTWIADRAIDFLSDRGDQSAPFFSFVSFPDPHHPFNPPGKYWNMYSPEEFAVQLPYSSHKNPPPPMRHLAKLFEQGVGGKTPQTAYLASPRHIQESMALTAGMITMIDDQIGRVIDALKTSGHYENTVIVFTSDHGDYMGDFGLVLKGALPFGSITRVPMIWSDPGDRAPKTSDALASTIDIPASILDRAGLVPFNGMQGESFLASLDGKEPHRSDVFIEYNDGLPRLGFDKPARVRSLRTREYRFTCYQDQGWGELYDLGSDPNESQNCWDNPNYATIKAELSLRLINQMTAQMDTSPLSQRLA